MEPKKKCSCYLNHECYYCFERYFEAQIFGLRDDLARSEVLFRFTQFIIPLALSFSFWSMMGWYTGWAMGILYGKLRPWK